LPAILGLAVALVVVVFAAAGIWVMSSLRLGGDARALRNAVFASAAARWDRKIEINAGTFTVNLARTGLQFAHLDSEARTALEALRAGEVGVYQFKGGRDQMDRAALFAAADRAMEKRGWQRLVGVMKGTEMVVVYVSKKTSSPEDLKVCFAVTDGEHLVIGSARADLEPLARLAGEQIESRLDHRAPVRLSTAMR
jgi:hypothetical protein